MTTEQKFDCVFCKEVFDEKEALQIHFRKHGDPNFNFNQSVKNKGKPQNDIANEKILDENETVGCDVCDEVFPTISKAITHKHKAHPDHEAKYFCPFCGKLFTMKHLYNKHIQSNHENEQASDSKEFHCDSCEVNFSVPSAMVYHNKFFHRQDTELPTIGQSKKVKTYNQEMIQIYYCSFCGEEYNNKVNLHKHMTDDHGDENQSPSDVLRCPLCEAIFYHLDAYEVHLMFHSTEDLYSEKNEIAEHVTDFSLEAVAPIMEKVEEDVPNESIENFLQLVMNDAGDNEPDKVKPKKHKKHKKSKKAAITLDEFLNMNKDVFGDGLDVQGIEEVPTQVVLKKVKGKKLTTKGQTRAVNADLAKLKKHGITITSKFGNQSNQIDKNDTDNIKIINKTNVTCKNNELLSKLLNQGNSEIKIVKKSKPQNYNTDNDTLDSKNDNVEKSTEDNIEDQDLSHNKNAQNVTNYTDNDTDRNVGITNQESADNTLCNTEDSCTNSNSNLQQNTSDDITIANDTKRPNNVPSELIKLPASTSNKTLPPSQENHAKISNKLLPDSIVSDLMDEGLEQTPDDHMFDTGKTSTQKDTDIEDETENSQEKDEDKNLAHDTLNALKHLSHLITVKSVNQPKSPIVKVSNDNAINEDEHLDRVEENISNKSVSPQHFPSEQKVNKIIKIKNHATVQPSKKSPSDHTQSDFESDEFNDFDEPNSDSEFDKLDDLKSPNVRRVKLKIRNLPTSLHNIPANNDINKIIKKETEYDDELQNEENSNNTPSAPTNLDILKRLTNVTAKSIGSAKNTSQPSNIKILNQPRNIFPRNIVKNSTEVEIFNIDDSDSDGEQLEDKQPNQNLDALRNLNKNITVKSNQQNVNTSEVKDKKISNTNTRPEELNERHVKLGKHSPGVQKSINLQNKLKCLGSNITVKSNNFRNVISNDHSSNFEEFDEEEANDSEPDNYGGKLKITEINENDLSDSECPDSRTDAIVESPHESNSENEDTNIGSDEEVADFEKQIKSAMVKKQEEPTTSKAPACLENFKKLNKNLTIKSLSAKKPDSEDESSFTSEKEIFEDSNNQQVAIKQLKPNPPQFCQPANKPNQSSVSMNQTLHKNVSSSSNQVVKTVKKFQSQTVIEEVTTTVTKTIRTVNQSTNEMVQSNNVRLQRPMMRPQKIINRVQGTIVRPSPAVGTRIRNAAPIRHPAPSTIKPSHQLVPVRGIVNLQRNPAPSTSSVRKLAPPKSSPQMNTKSHMIGKLKISPHALNQATKRMADEATGHFNCFKKPKESPSTSMDSSLDDATMQFTSGSKSQSNFSSVTKSIKGKGVVTTMQMREVSTSSQQQLSKINNMSGLMVAKTSSKQAMHVEESNVISTAKRNTLNALEKLQKQGLLVKKPRLDDYNEKSQSESDDDQS